jgi:hypothetical protein
MLDEMQQGEAAVKRMAELDTSSGLQLPADVARRMRGKTADAAAGVLGDNELAKQRLEQADKMEREATGLINEAKRLRDEAVSMDPALKPKSNRGRPKKEAAVV